MSSNIYRYNEEESRWQMCGFCQYKSPPRKWRELDSNLSSESLPEFIYPDEDFDNGQFVAAKPDFVNYRYSLWVDEWNKLIVLETMIQVFSAE